MRAATFLLILPILAISGGTAAADPTVAQDVKDFWHFDVSGMTIAPETTAPNQTCGSGQEFG
jgi:hypothetical protein